MPSPSPGAASLGEPRTRPSARLPQWALQPHPGRTKPVVIFVFGVHTQPNISGGEAREMQVWGGKKVLEKLENMETRRISISLVYLKKCFRWYVKPILPFLLGDGNLGRARRSGNMC